MNYIADTLGVEISAEPWCGSAELPYFLADRYSFQKVSVSGVSCIFIKPVGELDTLTVIKKHLAKIRETEPLPIVLELSGISAQRRKSLISARIPFVAPGCQLYLPFMGVALTERYTSETPPKETLMPSSQLLLFYYLYMKEPELQTNGMDKKLNLSAMQISRAIRQLRSLSLITVRKDGVQIVLRGNVSHAELFERSAPHLLNPVRKRIYAEDGKLQLGLPLSGLSALSERTMLGLPTVKTVAFYGKSVELAGTDELIDSEAQTEVEIWKYDPSLLSDRPGLADPLSLAVALRTTEDERVQQAIEEMLKDVLANG